MAATTDNAHPLSLRSDEELMELVQAGDPSAYEALFERYHARIHSYLVRKTRSPQTAADLYQETFLRVYRARASWNPGGPSSPGCGALPETRRGIMPAVRPAPRRDRHRRLGRARRERHDARIHLEDAIASLPETLRDAFLLGAVEGFNHNEVAEQLEISPGERAGPDQPGPGLLRQRLEGRHDGASAPDGRRRSRPRCGCGCPARAPAAGWVGGVHPA